MADAIKMFLAIFLTRIGAVLIGLLLCAQATGQSMQLITSEDGWVLGKGGLFWTVDNGSHWKNITPQGAGAISDVFFLDTSQGWVLFADADENTNLISFSLAHTADSGQSWSIANVTVPSQKTDELDGRSWLDFVDPLHGWIGLPGKSNSASSWGLLLATGDGGKSWKELPGTPVAGRPVFVTVRDGWISGPGWAGVYSTHDGGNSWPGAGPSLENLPPSLPTQVSYGDVKFTDARHGFLPIWLQASNNAEEPRGTALVLYTTDDGGRTWKRDKVVVTTHSVFSRIGASCVVPDPSGSGSVLIVRFNDKEHLNPLTLMTVDRQGGATAQAAPRVSSKDFFWRQGDDVAELSFVTSAQGWARTRLGDLLMTEDGGATWKDISPIPPRRP